MKKLFIIAILLTASCLLATGCGSGAAKQTSAGEMKILTAAETTSYRTAIMREEGQPFSIVEPGKASSEWNDLPEARKAVADAVLASAVRLAAVDYAALSLSDFVTPTRAMKLDPSQFTGRELEVDAYMSGQNATRRWALYRWQGPELPRHPDRPAVQRWIHVYALYSYDSQAVTRLLATIFGEANE